MLQNESVQTFNDGIVLRDFSRGRTAGKSVVFINVHLLIVVRAVDLVLGKRESEVHFLNKPENSYSR